MSNYVSALAHVVESAAPALASAMTGPVGGIVVELVERILGIDTTSPDAILHATNTVADPSIQARLKQLELDHVDTLQKLANDDVANARGILANDLVLHILAYAIAAGFFVILALNICLGLNISNNSLVTVLNSAFSAVIFFYFGASYQQASKGKK